MKNFFQSWSFFFISRACIGLVPGAIAWAIVSNVLTILHTR